MFRSCMSGLEGAQQTSTAASLTCHCPLDISLSNRPHKTAIRVNDLIRIQHCLRHVTAEIKTWKKRCCLKIAHCAPSWPWILQQIASQLSVHICPCGFHRPAANLPQLPAIPQNIKAPMLLSSRTAAGGVLCKTYSKWYGTTGHSGGVKTRATDTGESRHPSVAPGLRQDKLGVV